MKMHRILILAFFLIEILSPYLIAQDIKIIEGVVVDTSKNSLPIDFTSIGITGKNVGTISNESGFFKLSITDENINDSLTFSKIGYFPQKINISELVSQKSIKIFLVPKITELGEVLVLAKKTKARTSGNITRAKGIVLAISSGSVGSEVGTVIRLPADTVYIKDLNFHIVGNNPDSAKFRINIYTYKKKIGENMLTENLYFTIPGKIIGDFKVDLSLYKLSFCNDIFITVEPVSIHSNRYNATNDKNSSRINISGTITGSDSYFRKVSLGNWQKIKYSFSPGFWVTYLK